MLESVSAADLAVAVAVAFFACTVFSAMGFGIGIVGLPLLLLAFDAPTAIILLNVLATPVVVVMVLRNREHLPGREIAPIALAGIVGSLIGARALRALDIAAYSDALGVVILALIILLTVGGMFKMPFPKPNPRIAGPVAGFLVGLFITAIGVGGPLLVLFMLSQGWSRQSIRGSMALFFVFMTASLVGGYAVNGLLTPPRLTLIAAAFAPAVIAAVLGDKIAERLTDAIWRRAVVAMVLGTSALALAREAVGLWGGLG